MEEWRDIPGHEGRYEVSSDGRVRNVKRQTLLAPFVVSDKGYHVVALHLPPEGKKRPRKNMKVHRLRPIAETLAMLDGNAFFGAQADDNGEDTHYRGYLPEAFAIYEANGGDNGWAGEASFARAHASRSGKVA